MKERRKIAILGGQRIPFSRQNTNYVNASNVQMLTVTLAALVERFDLKGQRLGEVVAGAVLKHTRDFNLTREATLASGLAPQTPAYDVQQACATSLEAAILVGNKIAMGQIESGIAGGVDSASDAPIALSEGFRKIVLALNRAKTLTQRIQTVAKIRPHMLVPSAPNVNERRSGMSMGEHCEIMVKRWGITREAQDELTLISHRNGVAAYEAGFYESLIVPFMGLIRDNNLRSDTSIEKLAKLRPVFDKTSGLGTLTAGNSTPLTDGAAAIMMSSESWAHAHDVTPAAWLIDAETAAVEYIGPDAEGLLMAPAYAVPRLLARNGLTLQDFDFYEIHEAFAGQVLCTLKAWEDETYCKEQLGLSKALGSIDRAKLNVRGGSVALGHPFAATGARILGSLAHHLALHKKATGKSARALVSICAAGGLGAVAILES
jgi:acetyl-CoA C-acetyltransferase